MGDGLWGFFGPLLGSLAAKWRSGPRGYVLVFDAGSVGMAALIFLSIAWDSGVVEASRLVSRNWSWTLTVVSLACGVVLTLTFGLFRLLYADSDRDHSD